LIIGFLKFGQVSVRIGHSYDGPNFGFFAQIPAGSLSTN